MSSQFEHECMDFHTQQEKTKLARLTGEKDGKVKIVPSPVETISKVKVREAIVNEKTILEKELIDCDNKIDETRIKIISCLSYMIKNYETKIDLCNSLLKELGLDGEQK